MAPEAGSSILLTHPKKQNRFASVAQLDRVAVYGTAGHEFESCPARHIFKAGVAQLVEQLIRNQ